MSVAHAQYSCIHVTQGVTYTRDVVLKLVGLTKGGPWVLQALWRIDQGIV